MGTTLTGGETSTLCYIYKNGDGPSTFINGGTHGGEITYPVFRKLAAHLEKHEFKGKITLLPVSNPIAWSQRLYFSTAGKFSMYDGKDWNWRYPGNADGVVQERFAHMVFTEVVQHDFVIDLHTSRWSKPFLITGKSEHLPLAKASGIDYTYASLDAHDLKGTNIMPLSYAADMHCKNGGVTLECGSHDSMNDAVFEYCYKVVLNMLVFQGHFDDYIPLSNGMYYTGYHTYTAPEAGFVEYHHAFWDTVKAGEVLYTLYPANDLKRKVEIIAKADCLVAKYQPTHIAQPGDQVVMTVPTDQLHLYSQ
ncbi:succinylglutamate desuccinylase/aspartoacylase family protein [Candidatus Peribacteria bacterium]|nr:succinylglutamate desuccinylase/aspartoacylase family protein [Candidatus Peribacteria bacterium]